MMRKITPGFIIGIVTALLHLTLALLACEAFSGTRDAQAGLVFLPFILLDIPVSLILLLFGDIGSQISPLIQYGVLGSLQWFLIPWLTGILIERKHPDRSGVAKSFSIIGIMILLCFVFFYGLIPLQSAIDTRNRRSDEIKESMRAPTSDYLTQRVVFSKKFIESITSINNGPWRANAGKETLLAFNRGIVLLDDSYIEQDRVNFSDYYVSVTPVGAADGRDFRLLAHRHFESASLCDSQGGVLWTHSEQAEGEMAIGGSLSGDIDGDGVPEIAVYRTYRDGIKLLDKNGKTKWKYPARSIKCVVMADVRGNDKEELFFKEGNNFITLDAEGTVVDTRRIPNAPSEYALIQWPTKKKRPNMLLPGKNEISIVDMNGRMIMELDAPGCRTYGAINAVAVRFKQDQPPHLAVRKILAPDIAALYVYDASGALVYQTSEPRQGGLSIPALATVDGSDGEKLLAGQWKRFKGSQLVEYSLSPDAVVAPIKFKLDLLPRDAIIEGGIRIENKPTGECLGYWNNPKDVIRFDISELEKASYNVTMNYAAPSETGGKLSIKFNEHIIQQKFGTTGSWHTLEEQNIGLFEHTGGSVAISLSILEPNKKNAAVMNFFSMTFEKK